MKKSIRYSVDETMLNVARSLVRDFRTNLDNPEFCSDVVPALGRSDVSGIRKFCAVDVEANTPIEFKAEYQVKNLLKRYRFQKDLYTDDELVQKAIDGFLATQNRLADYNNLDSLDTLTKHVLDVAAKYIAHVLGEFSDDEHRSLCKFGSKASVGVPLRKACEAARWELPMSGSAEQIAWFDSEMSQVECVREYWAAQQDSDPQKGSIYQEVNCLTLVLVPKTFKSLRSIMPNTTIGSYMSGGIGEMIRKRLKRVGYDIRTLQSAHRVLAQESSITGKNVTVDLSAASDTISTTLVSRLLPLDWFEAMNLSRIGTVRLPDGSEVESKTFCTMGIGYTFPLQTLIFLSLLKAIARITSWGKACDISVYGDDMIFDASLYGFVEVVFSKLGFIINEEKSFSDGPFRESCGGDYHSGVDVRPFQPRNGSACVSKTAYEAVLYKTINGLLRRWSEHEIEGTLACLLSELSRVVRGVKIVPGDFPDDSGVRCPTLALWSFLSHVPSVRPKSVGHGVYRFSFLRFRPDERKETRHEPYLWVALRAGKPQPVIDWDCGLPYGFVRFPETQELINCATGVADTRTLTFHTVECEPIVSVRSCLTGQRQPKLQTNLTISGSGRYIRQSGTSCFDGRS